MLNAQDLAMFIIKSFQGLKGKFVWKVWKRALESKELKRNAKRTKTIVRFTKVECIYSVCVVGVGRKERSSGIGRSIFISIFSIKLILLLWFKSKISQNIKDNDNSNE